LAANFCSTKSNISSLVPGSCPPNWLHGNANIVNPRVLYVSYNFENWV
jgi:hypothetical protein